MWSSQRWLVIEQLPIKFTGASRGGRKLACTLPLCLQLPCVVVGLSFLWGQKIVRRWHSFLKWEYSVANTRSYKENFAKFWQKTGVSSNSCLLTDYTQLWVFWKRVVLSRNLPRDGCLALWAPSGNGKRKTHWFRVCLPWCGIGWLNNVEHMELNALGTVFAVFETVEEWASSRHENQPWLLHSKQTVDFPLSFVSCELKPLRLLLVHIIIYVSVIHVHFGSTLFAH